LPGSSGSKHLGPFSLSHAADETAKLIRAHAKNRKCHVVGFSGGGYVGVTLAHKYPELVQSLFISGVYDLKCWGRILYLAPYSSVMQSWLPASLVSFVYAKMGSQNPPGLHEDAKANTSNLKIQKTAWNSLKEFDDGYPLIMRALVVAGGNQDDLSGTQRLSDMFRTGNEESRAVVLNGAMHMWCMQRPELFADAVKSWIEERPLPAEFELLTGRDTSKVLNG